MLAADSLEYRVLRECIHREDLFVLFWLLDPAREGEVESLLDVLARLTAQGLLECRRGTVPVSELVASDLRDWIAARVQAGESLTEPPDIPLEGAGAGGFDFDFYTTSLGLEYLDPEDRGSG